MTELSSHCDTTGIYRHIGGWLILFAIGIVLYPGQILITLITKLLPAFSHATGPMQTMVGSQEYQALWIALLTAELVGNMCLLIFSICLVVSFFQRRQKVIRLAVVFLFANFAFVGLDFWVTHVYFIKAGSISPNSALNLVRTAVASAIWIPYFLFSRRAKRTFVN
jgi:hypothetical protein